MDKKAQTKTQNWANKEDLVSSISQISGFTQNVSLNVLNATLDSIQNALKEKKKVSIKGFGIFKVVARPAIEGRNPRTGESLQIPAKNVPKFSFSKTTKDAIA